MMSPETPALPPTISAVVPARNSGLWIGELLESVLAQDVQQLEVLVIDNGSTDRTLDLVTEYAARDSRVRLIRSGAESAAAARNEGVREALGEYLVFADSDDIVPDGAYRTMLESLVASGSDMVIGDHLKFSPAATWSPTGRWGAFTAPGSAVVPDDRPELLTGRACWNRMFRRSFWDRTGLRFPEIPSVEDIEPMTRAFVEAEHVDVVSAVVYLYRDRSDASSISQRSDAASTVRYLRQELACARLVSRRPALREQHATIVADADGWAHLARFVEAKPSSADIKLVKSALDALFDVVPLAAVGQAAPSRRALWGLMLADRWSVAASFAAGAGSNDAATRLVSWHTAMAVLAAEPTEYLELEALVLEGLLPVLVHVAEDVPLAQLTHAVQDFAKLPAAKPVPGLASAMADALVRSAVGEVLTVSRLRHVVPLVVDVARPTERGLQIGGRAKLEVAMTFVLRSGPDVVFVPVEVKTGSWSVSLDAAQLRNGRWTVTAQAAGVSEEFPVVTARMPLPPIDDQFILQPLADRRDGWRFLVDRRVRKPRGFGALLRRALRRPR